MPTSLTLDAHLDALEASGTRLLDMARTAGMAAPVPTCPAWKVDALVAHQSMVHRWATAHVTGANPRSVPSQTRLRKEVADLPAYFAEGHAGLLHALRAAPADLRAMVFLNDAPQPREFWARRQAHETTIHMVDALAASLGRLPTSDEVGIDADLAADGIDELLCGFFTRGESKLYEGVAYDVLVAPSDVRSRWLLQVGSRLTVVTPAGAPPAAVRLTGTAASVYLALWNRGDEVEATGRGDLLERWHKTQRVRWS